MFQCLLTVKYITSKNCFFTLSPNNFKHLKGNFISLEYNDDDKAYASVVSSSAVGDQSIGINSLYAKSLKIDENSVVTISEISRPPTVQSVTIAAIDDNDHLVLESLAATVQSTLLQQIHILFNGQSFIIWIGSSIFVTVTVCDIKPLSPGFIDNLTEVVIKPPGERHKQIDNKKEKTVSKDTNEQKSDIFAILKEYKNRDKNLVLRLVPFKDIMENIGELCHPFNVFVFKDSLPQNLGNTKTNPKIYSMKSLNETATETERKVYVRLYVFEDFIKDFKLNMVSKENVFVSDVLIDFFNGDLCSRVLLEPHKKFPPAVEEIEIHTKRNYTLNINETFQQYLADNCKSEKFILNPNIVLNVTNNLRCLLKFIPCEAKFCFVDSDFTRNVKLSIINEILPQKEILEKDDFSINKFATEITNYKEIVDMSVFLFVFNTEDYRPMNSVLITGKTGTGKSTLLNVIKHKISSHPYYIFTKTINCKAIKGKTVESLNKLLVQTLTDLIHHQPSVLILDDLHIICENVSEHDALAQNAVYFNRVSEMIEGVLKTYCEHNAIGILASTISTAKLNKNIYATRGHHLFKDVYHIDQLSKNDRNILLKFLFSPHDYENVNFEKLVEKTESFVMQDMVDLANKTLFESYQEDLGQNVVKITQEHCEEALKTVVLTSLEGINLHSPGDRDLDDIGGLEEAKTVLIETMLWPSKYPNLFANAPLRLPSGLLLYGPPGTGKTILAGAAAKHCGLRLISIKGPELLSKYIGASEQAVRDMFARAQSARPCVLFFDEFDSLAPRRGHDSTGVTDRVVNQLLTQLDGIETLTGVFVLAATSRPDLLDPALLRPGRLDKHIRCSLPDQTSRLDILKALSKNLALGADVRLEEVAAASEGFSGADLQAVLYTAQLESVKHLLEDEGNMQDFHTEICQAQLLQALKDTRPSLTKAELFKFEQIYRKFEGGDSKVAAGTKATLA